MSPHQQALVEKIIGAVPFFIRRSTIVGMYYGLGIFLSSFTIHSFETAWNMLGTLDDDDSETENECSCEACSNEPQVN